MAFRDRQDAGRQLAQRLAGWRDDDVVVLGLPRGGVPVAFEVAKALDAPLDVIIVRKLGVPVQPELGMGALGEDGVRVLNSEIMDIARVSDRELEEVERKERAEVARRSQQFRGERPRVPLEGRSVIIVDDGIATGSTARAACAVARAHGAKQVVLATPVAPPTAVAELQGCADEIVVLETPDRFFAIGQWYGDFTQTPDNEVTELLQRASDR
jgi:putative phosphoribosyl transferase